MKKTTKKLLVRGRIPGDEQATDLAIADGRIQRVSAAGRGGADLGSADALIAPVLFDIQVNGFGGIDLLDPALNVEDVAEITDRLAQWGVSRWAPTFITGPVELIERNCGVVRQALRDPRLARAIPGIHLEGPFISPEDGPRGAHPLEHVRPPDGRLFTRLHAAAHGKLLYMTLAPDQPGADRVIRKAVELGVAVSLGHHNADGAQIASAVRAGARLCTHLGNGTAAHMPRHHNPLWPQLAEDALAASLIADGHHLPDAVLKTFARVKGPGRTILVSDLVSLAGLQPGRHTLFGAAVDLRADGKICLHGTELLAGSAVPLLHGVLHAARVTDLTLAQAFACATRVPARLLGLRSAPVRPRVGARAEFVLLEAADASPLHTVKPRAVFIDGVRRV